MCLYSCFRNAASNRIFSAPCYTAICGQPRTTTFSHIISHFPTLSHIISHFPTLSHIISHFGHYLTLSHIFAHYLTFSHIISHFPTYLTFSNIISHYLTFSHIISNFPTLSHIFPHYLTNGNISEKNILNIKVCFYFRHNIFSGTSPSLEKNSARYDHSCAHVNM